MNKAQLLKALEHVPDEMLILFYDGESGDLEDIKPMGLVLATARPLRGDALGRYLHVEEGEEGGVIHFVLEGYRP